MDEIVASVQPEKAILLVMDYQPGIVDSLPEAAALLERAQAAIKTARDHGMAVGYVRVAFSDDDYQAISPNNKSFSSLAKDRRLSADAPETQIHPAVAPQAGDIVVRKTRVGSFSTTDLAKQLAERTIDTLVLAGIATSGVVLSTIRDAADHDYRLIVLEDACADRDPEVHRVLMEKVFPRQAHIIATDDLPKLMETV
jgi:nicotinamidase-related amidase